MHTTSLLVELIKIDPDRIIALNKNLENDLEFNSQIRIVRVSCIQFACISISEINVEIL